MAHKQIIFRFEARERTAIGADQLGDREALSRRDAEHDQLRPGQPGDSRSPQPQCLPPLLPDCDLTLLYDVSHNTCRHETHSLGGSRREFYVHRKGAKRALGAGDPALPDALRPVGQPVLIGGSMRTDSYVLVGEAGSEVKSFSSACHGVGRAMSCHAALSQWSGHQIVVDLAAEKIIIRRVAAPPGKRPARTRMSAQSCFRRKEEASRTGSRGSGLSSASRAEA